LRLGHGFPFGQTGLYRDGERLFSRLLKSVKAGQDDKMDSEKMGRPLKTSREEILDAAAR
jgi:hypothetical protein